VGDKSVHEKGRVTNRLEMLHNDSCLSRARPAKSECFPRKVSVGKMSDHGDQTGGTKLLMAGNDDQRGDGRKLMIRRRPNV